MVVFYHVARHMQKDLGYLPLGSCSQFGHSGVDLFFVLSGFIIFFVHRSDVGNSARLSTFIERRFTRIYPLYWFSLIFGLALLAASSTQKIPSAFAFLYVATLMPNSGEVGIAWTLQHETLFYFLVAFSIVNRKIGKAVLLSWLAIIVTAWILVLPVGESAFLQRLTSGFNIEFFFGMFAAFAVVERKVRSPKSVLALGCACFGLTAYLENLALLDGYTNNAHVAYGLSAMLIVMGAATAEMHGSLTVPAALVRLGKASYSIYLFHLPSIGIAYKLSEVSRLYSVFPVWLVYFLIVLAGVAAGMVVSTLFEHRLIDFTRRIFMLKVAP